MRLLKTGLIYTSFLLAACNGTDKAKEAKTDSLKTPAIREESVQLRAEGLTLNSFLYLDTNSKERRAAIIVVPEWWGLNDYAKMRARQLAGMGYMALALDMYGNGNIAADPKAAMSMAMPFYLHPEQFAGRLQAGLTYLRSRTEADTARIGAMGYCFGGSAVLQAARQGVPFRSVASFHGDYPGEPWPKGVFAGEVLICHGAADSMVTMDKYEAFRKRLDSAGVRHTDKVYPNATHAFTNPASTETGKKFNLPIRYNGAADTASWAEMKAFWERTLR